jgi:hypothetical protein
MLRSGASPVQTSEACLTMSPSEMEMVINNLDRRLTAVEQILPTLATKEDLKVLATKQDLKDFATRQDLKDFATKQDLKDLATKQELKDLATKQELKGLATKQDFEDAKRYALMLHEDIKGQLGLIAEHLADVMTRLPSRQ